MLNAGAELKAILTFSCTDKMFCIASLITWFGTFNTDLGLGLGLEWKLNFEYTHLAPEEECSLEYRDTI